MRTPSLSRRNRVLVMSALGAIVVILAVTVHPEASSDQVGQGNKSSVAKFDDEGALVRPEGYREWIYVGTPLTPNDMNGGEAPFPEFHAVYINPESYAAYKKTGKFPEGTMLVKELISVGSKKASSGNGYFMGDLRGMDVSYKDSKRFKDEPGNWAYFNFQHELPLADKARPQKASACNVCHEASADEDWVFTQYYPVLRAAKPKK